MIKYKKLEVTTQLMIKKNNKGRGRGLINFLPMNGEGGGGAEYGREFHSLGPKWRIVNC